MDNFVQHLLQACNKVAHLRDSPQLYPLDSYYCEKQPLIEYFLSNFYITEPILLNLIRDHSDYDSQWWELKTYRYSPKIMINQYVLPIYLPPYFDICFPNTFKKRLTIAEYIQACEDYRNQNHLKFSHNAPAPCDNKIPDIEFHKQQEVYSSKSIATKRYSLLMEESIYLYKPKWSSKQPDWESLKYFNKENIQDT